ncbi:3-methyl-2-oxobutanoate hydroxymethyltransferase [Grifola frondosa]|uniref:3-methyl-2-oxobutanoate hydroxymethyltransferase n=1 Tax=Grifola frondosa TaxID=5627 RepID=A0A1C7LPP8_GRIFR|nr:3-methyl-2-oxobutanoate hydroxymethyltransferase [Grifola frondosa]
MICHNCGTHDSVDAVTMRPAVSERSSMISRSQRAGSIFISPAGPPEPIESRHKHQMGSVYLLYQTIVLFFKVFAVYVRHRCTPRVPDSPCLPRIRSRWVQMDERMARRDPARADPAGAQKGDDPDAAAAPARQDPHHDAHGVRLPTGRACDAHGVDITLVGDSLAQVCLGYDSTTRLTLDEMVHHCRAVSRGSTRPLLVADMPFGTYHAGAADAVRSAVRLVREGRAEAVKIEGGREVADTVRRLTEVGIPVMGHVGLMPQRHVHLSGYRVQGRRAEAALGVLRDAAALERAGAFAVVLEAVPAPLGALVTETLRSAVTIGIGAGAGTDGQVLVWDDVMGTWAGHRPVFARRFAEAEWEETRRLAQEWMRALEEENGRSVPEDSG